MCRMSSEKLLISYLIKILYGLFFPFSSLSLITCRTLMWYLGRKGEPQLWQCCTPNTWPLFSLRAPASPFIIPIRAASHRPQRQTLLYNYAKYKFTMNNEYCSINHVLTAKDEISSSLTLLKVNLFYKQVVLERAGDSGTK